MDPDVNRRQSKKRLTACGKALPTDHQAAILLLEPGKGALRLKAWDSLFDRSPPVLFVFQTRFGICARIPPFRSCCRSAFASYPLSVAITLRRLRGRPRLPVCTLTASSNGTTCARSSPLAGVTRFAKGLPSPAVRLWLRIPLPFPP